MATKMKKPTVPTMANLKMLEIKFNGLNDGLKELYNSIGVVRQRQDRIEHRIVNIVHRELNIVREREKMAMHGHNYGMRQYNVTDAHISLQQTSMQQLEAWWFGKNVHDLSGDHARNILALLIREKRITGFPYREHSYPPGREY